MTFIQFRNNDTSKIDYCEYGTREKCNMHRAGMLTPCTKVYCISTLIIVLKGAF